MNLRLYNTLRKAALHVKLRTIAVLMILSTSTACPMFSNMVDDDKQASRIFRIAKRQLKSLDPPEETFAKEWFVGGEYVFVMLNRNKIAAFEVTDKGLVLRGADGKPLAGYAVDILARFHDTTKEALDPTRAALSGKYWYTERRLAAPRWEGEALLKTKRDRFYADLQQALGKKGGLSTERVRMVLPTSDGQDKLAACVVVHDGDLHEPAKYLASIAGIDASYIQPTVDDPYSIRVLDVKIQEYFCQSEVSAQTRGQGVFSISAALYQSAVSLYLDKRQDSNGRLNGLEFIKQYLAATIIGGFLRSPREASLPVGLFVETKVQQMDAIDGGRKYVLHRLIDESAGKDIVKALREAVDLVDQNTRGKGEDTLPLKLQVAQQLAEDPKRREPVRRVLKMFIESSRLLMPTLTQKALGGQQMIPAAPGTTTGDSTKQSSRGAGSSLVTSGEATGK